MLKTTTILTIIYLTVLVLMVSSPDLFSEWVESNNYGFGNLEFSFGGIGLYYIKIPNSNFMVVFKSEDIIILDIINMRVRGGRPLSHGLSHRAVDIFPDPDSGWNLYYFEQLTKESGKFGKLHINPDGTLGDDIWLPRYPAKPTSSAGVPDKSEIWYFTNKILCLNTIDETWKEYEYPEGWDSGFRYIESYPFPSSSSIII